MSPESVAPVISSRFAQMFVEAALQEVGPGNLPRMLEKVSLSPSMIEKDSQSRFLSRRREYIWTNLPDYGKIPSLEPKEIRNE